MKSAGRGLSEATNLSDEAADFQKQLNKSQEIFNAKNNPEALQELTQDAAKAQKADLLESLDAKRQALIEGAKEKYKGLGNFGGEGYGKYQGNLMDNGGKAKNVALGLRVDPKGNDLIEEFARNTDSYHVGQWSKAGLIKTDENPFVRRFYEALYTSIQSGGKIKFNLDFLSITKAEKIKRFSDPFDFYGGRHSNVSNWELQQILNNKMFYDNTEFFIGKDKLNLQDVLDFGLGFKGGK